MAIRHAKKGYWRFFFSYPSFNRRFFVLVSLILILFIVLGRLMLVDLSLGDSLAEKISIVNLLVQLAAFCLAILAAYYALRQLIETRFAGLDEAGMQELKRHNYMRAFDKWEEAFLIKLDPSVFLNMSEALLLVGDYETFDSYMQLLAQLRSLQKEIAKERSSECVVLYLRAMRHLFVKNQGEAEGSIASLIEMNRDGVVSMHWDFVDIQASLAYQDLAGECRDIAENLILYLSQRLSAEDRESFEEGKYAARRPGPELEYEAEMAKLENQLGLL